MTKQSLCFNITNIVDFMFFVPLNSDGHMETGPWFKVSSERLEKP